MRWLRPLALALVASPWLATAAASGPVTVRFRNTQTFPIYVDATTHDGVVWPFGTTASRSVCGQGCDCFALAPPIPRVRALAPGAVLEAQWDGRHFELRSCQGNGPDCLCAAVKQATPGRYEARVWGAPAVQSAGPAEPAGSPYQAWVSPDLAQGRCAASAAFDLGATPVVVEAVLTCEAAAPAKPRQ